MTIGVTGRLGSGHEAGTNRARFAATLVVAGPVFASALFVWMIVSVAQCEVFDFRMVAGPLVGIGTSVAAFVLALWCVVLRPTDGHTALLTVATLEMFGFGWTLVWFGLCIPAAP
jgi:hypothetical protein